MQFVAPDPTKSKLTPRQQHFLGVLLEDGGRLSCAADRAGILPKMHRDWLSASVAYREAFAAAASEGQRRELHWVWGKACDRVRAGDQQLQEWVERKYGEAILHRILDGDNPVVL